MVLEFSFFKNTLIIDIKIIEFYVEIYHANILKVFINLKKNKTKKYNKKRV